MPSCAVPFGIQFAYVSALTPMLDFFMAGPDLVHWDLTALGRHGPYRLAIHHAKGLIIEYFDDVTAALLREGELEDLLIAAGSADPESPGANWATVDRSSMNDGSRLRMGLMTKPATPAILVVDDDEGVTETFARTLRLEGYEVRTACSAETGLREVSSSRPDAIILDLRMPLINGLGFLYRLRSQDDHRATPVAVITGDYCLDESLTTELRELGARLFFKPLSLEDVIDLTRTLLDEAR